MAITVDEVAYSALSGIASNAGLLNACRWVSDRYRQLSNRGRLRSLRRVDSLVLPAAISTGTVTATRASDIVTGNAAAYAVWDPTLVGRYFRYARNWYEITGVEEDGSGNFQLRLRTEIAEATGTAVTYNIVQRHTKMPDDLRFMGSVVHQRLYREVTQLSLNSMNFLYPERIYVGGAGPEVFCEVGDAPDGRRLMEFYPYTSATEQLLYTYYAKSPDLRPGDPLPDNLDPEALKQGVLIDLYRWEMAKAMRDNKVDAAGLWGNMMSRQGAVWERRIEELLRADRSVDDVDYILHALGPPVAGESAWIRTAGADALSRLTNWP
jgi:hypothetical protein